jgi:deoxyribodipyrimidine photo-lyase
MAAATQAPVIVWFRNDLRLQDHPALAAAGDAPVVAVYILDEKNLPKLGAASKWWLHQSLKALSETITQRGGRLNIFQGDSTKILPALVDELSASALYFCHRDLQQSQTLEQAVHKACSHITVKRFAGELLQQPGDMLKADGKPYQVFTPFYKAFLQRFMPAAVKATELKLLPTQASAALDLDDLALVPKHPWTHKLHAHWQPGEAGAQQVLHQLDIEKLQQYKEARDFPALSATSQLSAHLHFGEVSAQQIWRYCANNQTTEPAAEPFLRQLVWREFSAYLLHYWPGFPRQAFKPAFDNFPWQLDDKALTAWQRGQTGYPLVDAGMRELWETGWMHNRVRMVTASFLCKHLLQPWQAGAGWFYDTLVDADIANNSAGWQWVAGCGADAAPYFRIFNPTLQSRKFDPQGEYLRRWLPELAGLSDKDIHAPDQATQAALQQAGITLGEDYPLPIVDHSFARERALAAYEQIR